MSVGRSTNAGRRFVATIGCLIGMAATSAGCTGDRVELGPDVPRPVGVTTTAATAGTCDDSGFLAVYAPFAHDFDAGKHIDVDLYFAVAPNFEFWWDPSDASGTTQARPDLASHFRAMYALGVRLPPFIAVTSADNTGGFAWDDHRGFAGHAGVNCVTGKITHLVIDSWSKAIAGRAAAASR